MNPIEQLILGLQCMLRTAREWARGSLWAPWLALLLLQAFLSFVIAWGAHPLFSWVVAPLLTALGEKDVLAYPLLFKRLPAIMARVDGPLQILVAPIVVGAATVLFAAQFERAPVRGSDAMRAALRRAPALIVCMLPPPLIAWGLHYLSNVVLGGDFSAMTKRLAPDTAAVLAVIVSAACLYAPVLVMLEGRGLRALLVLPGTWSRGFLAALPIIVVGALITLPTIMLARQADVIVERGVPELTLAVTLLRFAAGAVAAFVVTGAATLAWQVTLRDRQGQP